MSEISSSSAKMAVSADSSAVSDIEGLDAICTVVGGKAAPGGAYTGSGRRVSGYSSSKRLITPLRV